VNARHILHRDIETRSTIDLTDVGAWRYASDPSTDVWCVAYAVDDGPVQIWLPSQAIPNAFHTAARNSDWLIVAHNDAFERAIEELILAPRFGWPIVPLERHRCTMAMALANALPAALDTVAEVLELSARKDRQGAKLMRLMARPRKPRAGEDPSKIYWHDDPEKLERLYAYCQKDNESERELFHRLPPLSKSEQTLWALDALINRRGFFTDGPLLEAASRTAAAAGQNMQEELGRITAGALASTNQVAALQAWLSDHGCVVNNLRKPTLKHALRRKELDPIARRVIELRLDAAHAAAAKIDTLLAWRNSNGRVCGTLRYHGAGTGRWTGHGPQPQNFKRDGENIDAKIAAVLDGGNGLASPLEAVGDIARAMICAAPGHRLLIGDFSGIESRVLAFVSDQQSKLDQWSKFDRTGDPKDEPYYLLGRSCGRPEEVARKIGKTADLAYGFMGGPGAWDRLAPEEDTTSDADKRRYQQTWRSTHPQTVQFWHGIGRAAIAAVRKPGTTINYKRLTLACDGTFLRIALPAGRSLAYPFPRLTMGKFGKPVVTFKDNAAGKWTDCRFGQGAYGGLWTENIVQAVSRDLLASAMLRLEAAGYPVTLHVHDEIVCEAPTNFGSIEEFQCIITTLPDWAAGLPIAAKVRNGERFSKTESRAPSGAGGSTRITQAELNKINAGLIREGIEPLTFSAPSTNDALNDLLDAETELAGHPDSGDPKITNPRPFVSVEPEADHCAPVENPANPGFGGNGSDHDVDEGNGAKTTNGPGSRNGSKTEADHDTYAEDNAGQPFSDAYLHRQGYRLAHVFDYALPDGTLLYQQNRYELRAGQTPSKKRPRKRFLPHRKVNGQEIFGAGLRRIIFNWPAVMRAGPGATVFECEGEANATALINAGLLATTVLSHKWTPECVAALTGCHVIILEDHDDDGRKQSAIKRKLLAPIAASVRIVPTAHLWKHLKPPHREIKPTDDVEDWAELGGDLNKLLNICREIPLDGVIEAKPYQAPAEEDNAPWDWLYGRHLLRDEVCGTVAMGGTGKSSSSIVEALAMASGRPLLGQEVARPLHVVLINLEDTRNTMDKRIIAAMRHYGLTQADIGSRLIVKAKGEVKIKVARQLRSGDVERDEVIVGALTRLMVDHQADVLSIDSFIRTHRVNENDNSAIEEVVECFETIATTAHCNVHLWHHTRKGGGDKVTIESARGASAFIDGVRSARIFETMSAKEHAELKAVQPELLALGFYFRSFNGKRNFAPPADQSDWFKLESILLRNGDNVGVVAPWQYPATWSDLLPETNALILGDIEKGMPDGQRYSTANAAKKRMVWPVVQKHYPNKTKSQCRQIIATWVENGTLYESEYDDPVYHHSQTGLFLRNSKPETAT
jgi:DNA polymerase bacteriophage-type